MIICGTWFRLENKKERKNNYDPEYKIPPNFPWMNQNLPIMQFHLGVNRKNVYKTISVYGNACYTVFIW